MDRAAEVRTKVDAARALLHREGWSAAILHSQSSWAWITAGGRNHVSVGEAEGVAAAVITRDAAYVITTNIELSRLVDEEIVRLPFEPIDYPWHRPEALVEKIKEICDVAGAVSDLGIAGTRTAAQLEQLRYVMLEPEVERYRALGQEAAAAVEVACRAVEPGDAEADVAARIAYECVERDILPLVNLVAADDRIGQYRHPLPTDRRLKHTLLAALTGRRHGLHASLTRMASFGTPDEDLASRHAAVTNVDATVILASRPGSSLAELVATVMERYESEGYPGEWQLHHQGGLTGYAGREIFATPAAHHRLRAGEVVAWNPSITRVKSEDTVLVGEGGNEVLTRTGMWPENEVQVSRGSIKRPALLVR